MENPVVQKITERATSADKSIVLPEAQDPRVLQAARKITDLQYARVVLLGLADEIRKQADQAGVNLDGVEIVDPLTDSRRDEYVDKFWEKRKHKGLSREDADKMLQNPVFYGGFMVGGGQVDGMVAGSICPTADTVRSALFGVGLVEGNKTVSSCSVMNTIVPEIGEHGSVIFADTGVVPEPTVEQLADIAIAAGEACKSLLDTE